MCRVSVTNERMEEARQNWDKANKDEKGKDNRDSKNALDMLRKAIDNLSETRMRKEMEGETGTQKRRENPTKQSLFSSEE